MFKFCAGNKNLCPRIFMSGAGAAIVLAAIGYLGTDIWLASTQWLLISAIFALFGIYFKMEK